MAAPRRNTLVEIFWQLHPRLYRWTGGRIGGSIQGMPVLLLTTRGRKSGAQRTNALTYFPSGASYVVIASMLGEPRHPAWLHNLRAEPNAEILVGASRIPVRAREAADPERARIWSDVVATAPDYAEYQSRTTRQIPVVVLDRR